ncbi:MAG: hypothetical protein IKE14_00890 [Loktanella sp.]|nr:hypothetical protein [Loktanella sp.]
MIDEDKIRHAFRNGAVLSIEEEAELIKRMSKDAKLRTQNMKRICETGGNSEQDFERYKSAKILRDKKKALRSAYSTLIANPGDIWG